MEGKGIDVTTPGAQGVDFNDLGTISPTGDDSESKRGTTLTRDIATGPQHLPFDNGHPLVHEITLPSRSKPTSTRSPLLYFLKAKSV